MYTLLREEASRNERETAEQLKRVSRDYYRVVSEYLRGRLIIQRRLNVRGQSMPMIKKLCDESVIREVEKSRHKVEEAQEKYNKANKQLYEAYYQKAMSSFD
jgi:hypothetical protein